MARASILFVALVACLICRMSRADEAGDPRCAPAFERAQELRAKGERMAARDELTTCAAVCGEELRRYCVTWLTEVEAELASVVLVARRAGRDLPLGEVRVTVDGVARTPERGRIVLEPGRHRIALTHGSDTVTQIVQLESGREPRSVVATFPSPAPSKPPVESRGGTPVASWVLIGLGAATLTAAAVLTITGHVMRQDLKDECAPRCEPDSIVPIERQWIAAGVLAGAGGLMLVSAGVLAGVAGDGTASGGLELRATF
jgi:hypothetical protein